jgi:asparagine synthetase B (glutamine-hydrolysing)
MCGICGDLTFSGVPASLTALQAMTDALAPRGPDAEGVLLRGRVGFGHRRLNIVDFSVRDRLRILPLYYAQTQATAQAIGAEDPATSVRQPASGEHR